MNPYRAYARARDADGLTFVPEVNAWLISRYDDVREVLNRPEDFSSAGAMRPDVAFPPAVLAALVKGFPVSRTVVSSDGDDHERYRRPITRGLSPAKVTAAVPFIQDQAEQLVDAFVCEGKAS